MKEEFIARTVQAVVEDVLTKRTSMTLKLATALVKRVEQKAENMGLAVVVAVSDASARPVAIHCMDGAYIASFDVALNKTFTSAGLKISTAELGKLSQPGESLYGVQFTNEGKIVIFGGGEPLMIGDTMIGALGVSGGTAEQDTKLAAYGKSILKEVIACL
ncbi:MAG: heme-binding protein [Lachnospiraceae bacterium]